MSDVLPEPLRGELVQRFQDVFTHEPDHVAWAPGRINLIGEHIDYCDLPVMPMAIQRGTNLVFRSRADAQVHIASTDARFEPRVFHLHEEITPYPVGDWGNYVKAAAQTAVTEYSVSTGFDGIVHSTLPIASGLGSSSALVVTVALALLTGECDECRPFELMEALAEGERYVGVRGGGMDQAVILGARAGAATHVSFAPLRIELVPVPHACQFVAAHSLEEAAKSAGARAVYNARTFESERAFRVLAEVFGMDASVRGFGALIDEVGPGPVLEEAAHRLEDTLFRRTRHIVTEADRVLEVKKALASADLSTLGPLLCDSHRSLRDDYEVSTANLDELVEMAVASGAAGARLTGAGLGGCAIAACDPGGVQQLVEGISERFYMRRRLAAPLDELRFAVTPSEGARVIAL